MSEVERSLRFMTLAQENAADHLRSGPLNLVNIKNDLEGKVFLKS